MSTYPFVPLQQDEIEQHLRMLKSPAYADRRRAFNAIRGVNKADLERAWANTRALAPIHGGQLDCLGRVEVVSEVLEFERAIVTIISPGYETLLRQLVDSLKRVGETAAIVVFAVNESFDNLEGWDDIVRVRCYSREKLDAAIKGVVYSCSRWIRAKHILSLESDMVVLESLAPLWATMEQTMRGTVVGVRPLAFIDKINSIQWVLNDERQEKTLLPWLDDEDFVFNGGLLGGDYAAWLKLDELLTNLGPYSFIFVEGAMKQTYTEEMMMNWAVNHMLRVELHPGWNIQFFNTQRDLWLTTLYNDGRRYYECHAFPAKILHFMGPVRKGPWNLMSTLLREIQENDAFLSRMRFYKCRDCGKAKSCTACFDMTTVAKERLSTGERSAVCDVCQAKREGRSPETVPLDVRMEMEN